MQYHDHAATPTRPMRSPVAAGPFTIGRAGYRLAASRRSVLRGVATALGLGAAGALAGCDPFGGKADAGSRDPVLVGLLENTRALADRYDATIAAMPSLANTLRPIRDAHRAHVTALAQAIGVATATPTAPASAAPANRSAALSALAAAEKAGRDAAVAACLSTTARMAPLLGSIAAARASHLEILK